MSSQLLVLDANILIRAVLGKKVLNLLIQYSKVIQFFTPDVCFEDAAKYLPALFEKRALSPNLALDVLYRLEGLLQVVDKSIYQEYMVEAQNRMRDRDLYDWPVVATALTLNSPLWTEDRDFFGSGIAVWTTDRIHLYFKSITTH